MLDMKESSLHIAISGVITKRIVKQNVTDKLIGRKWNNKKYSTQNKSRMGENGT